MSDRQPANVEDVVDPGRRYPCAEDDVPTHVFLKRSSPWPLSRGTKILYKKSESASAHWMGALVADVREDGFFWLRKT